MIKLFGLKNCDTCRKAKKWLEAEGLDYSFIDVRKDGVSIEDLSHWADVLGWEKLLNRRGTTWRTLDEDAKSGVDQAKAVKLMLDAPALMKRPVFVAGDELVLGFKKDQMDILKSLK